MGNNFTDLATTDPVVAATFNDVLDELDAAIKVNKWDGTAAPTVNDDSGDGYSVGSRWVDVTNDLSYICVDATIGAAVWRLDASRIAFLAINSATDSNVTGNNVTVDPVDFDLEIFDIGSNFASDVFTAPVTGYYVLTVQVMFEGLQADHTLGVFRIVTSNRSYYGFIGNPYAQSANGSLCVRMAVVADMDAADTAKITVVVTTGDQDVNIYGGSSYGTFFGGVLVA